MSVAPMTVTGVFNNPHPFLAEISANVDDIAADAVVRLLATGGVEQISMSAVARLEGVSSAAVQQRHGGRAAFLDGLVGRFSVRWVRWVTRSGYLSVIPLRLPGDDEELLGVRAWQLIRALAEGEARAGRPACAAHVTWALAQERDHVVLHLTERLGRHPDLDQVAVVLLLADGLRHRVADREAPMPAGVAKNLLRNYMTTTFGLELEAWDVEPASGDTSADLAYT